MQGTELRDYIDEQLEQLERINKSLVETVRDNDVFFEVTDRGGIVIDFLHTRSGFYDKEQYVTFGENLYDMLEGMYTFPMLSNTEFLGYMQYHEGHC